MRTDRMTFSGLARLLPRLALALLMLAGPAAAVQAIGSEPGGIIGEDLSRSSGAGLVLLVSLQRG